MRLFILAVMLSGLASAADNSKINADVKATKEMLKIMTKIKKDQAELNVFYQQQSQRCLPGVVIVDQQGTVTCVAAPQPPIAKPEEKK